MATKPQPVPWEELNDLRFDLFEWLVEQRLAKPREKPLAAAFKLQSDPRFTALSFNDAQRTELQQVTAPAVAEWKANMAKLGIDGERLYARARELIQQYKVATK